ncbi:MAG: esterase [FCB group bacterium]|jgi:esterase/lipase superfamily enzyme
MQKDTHKQWSSHLSKDMEIAVYGHYGFVVLMFPTDGDDCLEAEKLGLVEALLPALDKGKCRIFSISSVNQESWLSPDLHPEDKSYRHFLYNNYVVEELLPFIFSECGGPLPVITCGAKLGAYHAANTYFRRPDLFYGTIAMSGTFNIEHFTQGFYDDNCYFNSPVHYLPNLNDSYWLSFLASKHHVYLLSGSGKDEHPENTTHLGDILSYKGIPHFVDIWGSEWSGGPATWQAMLKFLIEHKL